MGALLPLPAPGLAGEYGYSGKVWFAHQLEQTHFGGVYYVWFARELNPIKNGPSSNPLVLFQTIDQAVKSLITPRDPHLARKLRREIQHAPIEMFRPALWRIKLGSLDPVRLTRGNPGWDEHLIIDLQTGEFEIL